VCVCVCITLSCVAFLSSALVHTQHAKVRAALGSAFCMFLSCNTLQHTATRILYVVLLPRSTGADSTRNARRIQQGSTKRLRQPHSCNRAKKGPTTGASSTYAKGADHFTPFLVVGVGPPYQHLHRLVPAHLSFGFTHLQARA